MRDLLPPIGSAGAYLTALTALSLGVLLKLALDGMPGGQVPRFITLYPAVVVCAIAAGPRIGVLAAIASALIAAYLWMPTLHALEFANLQDIITLLLFALFGSLTGWIVGNARLLLEDARDAEHDRERAAEESVHRIKNLITVTQAISRKAASEVSSVQEYQDVLWARLDALGKAQAVLLRRDWRDAALGEVVHAALSAFKGNARLEIIEGPNAQTPAPLVSGLCMALYELCTNALKYGALGEGEGHVRVSWDVADGYVTLRWDEQSAARAVDSTGLGSRLIRTALANAPGTSVGYEVGAQGVRAVFRWRTP